MLFIDGGDEAARTTFREGRGYWSAAATLVLEKHGFLDFERGTLDDLHAPDKLGRFALVIVARLPEAAWTTDLLTALDAMDRPLLLEGPLPTAALALVEGVEVVGSLPRDGAVYLIGQTARAAAERYGYPPNGRVETGSTREISRRADLDWNHYSQVPLTEAQAAAWRTPGWDVQNWSVREPAEVLADWLPKESEERRPAIVRSGNVYACAFSLLAFLGQSHTAEPFDGQIYRNWPRVTGIEFLLLALLDSIHADTGVTRARVMPWPRGVRWVMNVRHDFDRPRMPAQVADVADRHDRAGTSATWYWRARHLTGLRTTLRRFSSSPAEGEGHALKSVGAPLEAFRPLRRSPGNTAVRLVARRPNHEVAIHTDLLWAGVEDEKAIIEKVTDRPVLGSSAHGDPDCFRFQGAPNVLWANHHGLLYTELIEHAHCHPHRFATLEPDGVIRPLSVLCLPHHESFDRSTTPGDVAHDALLEAAERWMRLGGMLQVMNHPDQNIDELFRLLADMPGAGRLDWTAAEAADWWRRTHVAENLQLETRDDGSAVVSSKYNVERLVVELLEPDGGVRRRAISVEAHGKAIIGGARVAAA